LLICEGFWTRGPTVHNRSGKDIGSQWTIVDYECNVHNVTYNMDIHTPMITQSWNDLRSFYVDKLDKLYVLKYVGNCSFQIHFSRCSSVSKIQDNLKNNIAIRHPLTMSKLIHFQVELSRYYCQASHLVRFFLFCYIYLNVLLISSICWHYFCKIWKNTLRVILKTMEFQLLFSTDQRMKSNLNWS